MRQFRHSLPVIIVLAVLASQLASAQPRSGRRGAKPTTAPPVATVNGSAIPADRYEEMIRDHFRYEGDNTVDLKTVDPLIADTVLLQLVDEELIRQEAARRGIVVNRNAAVKLLISNPPDFIRQPFLDNQGSFHRDLFELVVRDPNEIVRMLRTDGNRDSLVKQWRTDIDKVIRYVQTQEVRRRLLDALEKDSPVTAAETRARYFAEKTRLVGSFVRVLHSTIPDSLVPITRAEARAWFDAHREEYYAPPSRLLGTVILPIVPNAADSAAHRASIDSVRRLMEATPIAERAALVRSIQKRLPPDRFPTDRMLRPSQLTSDMLRRLATAKTGDLAGPFVRDDESIYLYVAGRAPVADTVLRARHILLRVAPGDLSADSTARELAKLLLDSIHTEEQFRQGAQYFSTDASSAQDGDLGWFARGRMVRAFDSAAFIGTPGTVIGPVRSEFGYHLIWVNERLSDGFALRELRFPLVPSKAAEDAARRDAESFARAFRGEINADSLSATVRRRYPELASDTSYVKRLERYGDVLAPSRFAFGAKVGDVAIIRLPLSRLMVTQLQGIWPGGTPEFEKFIRYPEAHARRARQLDILEPRMKAIADSITPDMLIGPLRSLAPMAEVFLINDRSVTAPPDEKESLLDSLVQAVPKNSVGGPVRGKHGFYFLRVLEKTTPTSAEYERDRAAYAAAFRERHREELLRTTVANARARAEFVDRR